jgi:hypothetical protein
MSMNEDRASEDDRIRQEGFDTPRIKSLIPMLFSVCDQLESAAPGLNFQSAGQVIGTIGELLVCD